MTGDSKEQADDNGDAAGGRARYVFANVEFDAWLGRLRVDGEFVDVEPRPLRLLAELLRRVNEVLTKEELLDAVWQGRPTVDHVLANAISKLRSALGPAGAARLVTLPRIGYRFSGPVQRLAAGGVESAFAQGQTLVGRDGFVLDRPLGPGGNSEVWLARHAKLGQSHVFKLASDGPRLATLKREYTLYRVLSQTLGPRNDFARILDANFQAPPFFLECEYGGRNLQEWAADGTTLQELTLQERLDIFLQVAGAVAAAHSVGVLHKDLKPSNVLIAGQRGAWVVKLTDFGSGRLLEPERLAELRLTALGLTQAADAGVSDSRASSGGTLMYMAPELLAGQAPTIQGDVFSLGVVLFQLAVGDLGRPLSTGWQQDVADPLLREEIEAATQGAPARRTASVANLVDNLSRLEERRQERAAQAANATMAQAAAAGAARRRARLPWLVMGVVGLSVGFLVSVLMFLRADRARAAALDAQAQTLAVSNFLHQDVLDTPDVVTSGTVRPIQLMDVMRSASMTASERFKGQPLAEAAVRRRIAETYLRRAAVSEARSELGKADALLTAALPADADELLTVRFILARAALWGQDKDKARSTQDTAEKLAGPQRMNALTELGAAATRARIEFLLDAGQADAAVPLAKRLIEQTDALVSARSHRRLDARQRLAEAYVRAGMDTEATALFAELSQAPFNAPNMAVEFKVRDNAVKVEALFFENRVDEAEVLLRESRALMLSKGNPNPFYMAFVELNLSACHWFRGQFPQALQKSTAALPLFVDSVGPDHVYIPMTQINIAQAALQRGYSRAALALYETADQWWVEQGAKRGHAVARFGRAAALLDLGRAEEALAALNDIDPARLASLDRSPGLQARVQAERGRILLALGRRDEAKPMLRQAVADMKAAKVPGWQVARYERLL
jgi:eukaryotic-like serine/threonine-protein kinase